ncbi:hypothetical protein BDV33DRAFT_199035 [Aspergillus novoparasiticus]|uniref:Major facilitator superfamily (MFS) profile domain-containing protein n=1 Tax=Aspergillus novoparasiticus TaxID=986946 RepID=A0A5N6F6D3_9EURO|nr:hypothetical protein BDV33DRAFT_199035 [Aspergillus novoparasiticus]
MEYRAQHVNDRRLEKWWKDASLCKLLAWQGNILISQMTTGYDECVVGSFQTIKPWIEEMGNPVPSQIGLITTIIFVGGFMGALVASLTADYFGRRVGMLIGASRTFIGTAIQIAAQNSNIFIGGRLMIGVGITFTCVTGPSLLFELARPSMRGTIASLFNVLWYVGSIIGAWTTCGTSHLPTSWAWRIPSLIQGVPAILVMTSVLAGLSESSRWRCANGRLEEAQKLLAKYHGHGDPSSELMTQEIADTNHIKSSETSQIQRSKQLVKSIPFTSEQQLHRLGGYRRFIHALERAGSHLISFQSDPDQHWYRPDITADRHQWWSTHLEFAFLLSRGTAGR